MQLLKTKDYLLLIDEEAEIKPNDLFCYRNYKVLLCTGINNTFILTGNKKPKHPCFGQPPRLCNKIIAYYPLNSEAKELDLPELPPFEEVNIEKLACDKYGVKEGVKDYDERYFNSHNVAKAEAFIEGYKAAQSKGQYSLADMKKAIDMAREQSFAGTQLTDGLIFDYSDEEIIQSLSTQRLPVSFEPEYLKQFIKYDEEVRSYKGDGFIANSDILKTITNSEGKEEIVGTYKY